MFITFRLLEGKRKKGDDPVITTMAFSTDTIDGVGQRADGSVVLMFKYGDRDPVALDPGVHSLEGAVGILNGDRPDAINNRSTDNPHTMKGSIGPWSIDLSIQE
jgi:hypothetical protein